MVGEKEKDQPVGLNSCEQPGRQVSGLHGRGGRKKRISTAELKNGGLFQARLAGWLASQLTTNEEEDPGMIRGTKLPPLSPPRGDVDAREKKV